MPKEGKRNVMFSYLACAEWVRNLLAPLCLIWYDGHMARCSTQRPRVAVESVRFWRRLLSPAQPAAIRGLNVIESIGAQP